MMRNLLGSSVLVIAAFGAPLAMADPIDLTNYTITFTGIGLLPTAGSFTYDPDTPTFTDFSVTMEGITFDLTSAANNPILGTIEPVCVNGATGAAATFAVMQGNCSAEWAAVFGFGSAAFGFFAEPDPQTHDFYVTVAGPQTEEEQAFLGSWSIEDPATVPEPSSLILVATVLLPVALLARKRTHKSYRQ